MADATCMKQENESVDVEDSWDVEEQQYSEIAQCKSVTTAQVPVQEIIVSSARIEEKSHFEFDVGKLDNVRVTGMVAVECDRLLLCNSKDKSLLVYTSSGKYLQDVSVSSYPFDIALLSERNRAVISFQRELQIQFIDISPTFVTPAEKMDIINPSTGGISAFDNKIAIAKRHGVDIYSIDGVLVTSFESSLDNIYYLKYSGQYTGYTDCRKLVVKSLNNTDKLSIIPGKIIREHFIPHGFVFDKSGNLYYTNYKLNGLFRCPIKERLSRTVCTEDAGLYGPRALCISTDYSKLYIANNDGQSIYVYNL